MRWLRWLLPFFASVWLIALCSVASWGQTCTTTVNGSCTYVLPPDPTGGSLSSLGSDMVSWVSSYGIPVFLGLVAVGLVLRLVVRLVKRGAMQV